jgi:peptide/nickel transport system permease protein
MTALTTSTPASSSGRKTRRPSAVRRSQWINGKVVTGAVGTVAIILIAFIGPYLAPHGPGDIVGAPYQLPGGGALLGTDYLGEDVWSRVLAGGRTVVRMSVAATVIGTMTGTLVGLAAGYSRKRLDKVLVWSMDVLLAFPGLVMVLLFVSLLGSSAWLIVVVVSLSWVPVVGRLVRGSTLQVVEQEYVEVAEMMGVPSWRILLREVVPNIFTPVVVQAGAVLTWSIGYIAGISFLGFGIQSPAADWGLMINQNRAGLVLQPWATVVPIVMVAIFALATNTLGDGLSEAAEKARPSEENA